MTVKNRNAAEGRVLHGASEMIKSGQTVVSEDTTSPRKFKYVEPRHRSKRTSKFAQRIAAEEFGHYRHFAWRQWGDFVDTKPAELAKRRAGR